MKFITVDMARALTERFSNAPKTREVMIQIYNAALQGKSQVCLGPEFCPPNSHIRLSIVTFFMGLGYKVTDGTKCVFIEW